MIRSRGNHRGAASPIGTIAPKSTRAAAFDRLFVETFQV
jgi:hypothetical protein